MTTIAETGLNLASIQNRLLAERQKLVDEKARQEACHKDEILSFERHIVAVRDDYRIRTKVLEARISEIDSIIGDQEPMRMAAE